MQLFHLLLLLKLSGTIHLKLSLLISLSIIANLMCRNAKGFSRSKTTLFQIVDQFFEQHNHLQNLRLHNNEY